MPKIEFVVNEMGDVECTGHDFKGNCDKYIDEFLKKIGRVKNTVRKSDSTMAVINTQQQAKVKL